VVGRRYAAYLVLDASGITEKEMHLFRGARSADAPAFMTTAVALYEQMDTAGA
jgi:hypothetical protein